MMPALVAIWQISDTSTIVPENPRAASTRLLPLCSFKPGYHLRPLRRPRRRVRASTCAACPVGTPAVAYGYRRIARPFIAQIVRGARRCRALKCWPFCWDAGRTKWLGLGEHLLPAVCIFDLFISFRSPPASSRRSLPPYYASLRACILAITRAHSFLYLSVQVQSFPVVNGVLAPRRFTASYPFLRGDAYIYSRPSFTPYPTFWWWCRFIINATRGYQLAVLPTSLCMSPSLPPSTCGGSVV